VRLCIFRLYSEMNVHVDCWLTQENVECDFDPVTSSPAPVVHMIDALPPTAVRTQYLLFFFSNREHLTENVQLLSKTVLFVLCAVWNSA